MQLPPAGGVQNPTLSLLQLGRHSVCVCVCVCVRVLAFDLPTLNMLGSTLGLFVFLSALCPMFSVLCSLTALCALYEFTVLCSLTVLCALYVFTVLCSLTVLCALYVFTVLCSLKVICSLHCVGRAYSTIVHCNPNFLAQ